MSIKLLGILLHWCHPRGIHARVRYWMIVTRQADIDWYFFWYQGLHALSDTLVGSYSTHLKHVWRSCIALRKISCSLCANHLVIFIFNLFQFVSPFEQFLYCHLLINDCLLSSQDFSLTFTQLLLSNYQFIFSFFQTRNIFLKLLFAYTKLDLRKFH